MLPPIAMGPGSESAATAVAGNPRRTTPTHNATAIRPKEFVVMPALIVHPQSQSTLREFAPSSGSGVQFLKRQTIVWW